MGEKTAITIILGPTASGKESAAFALAPRLGAEIVSVDSMKIYRTLDVGTAKATAEMRSAVRHHCLDLIEPTYDDFSVGEYVAAADSAIGDIVLRGKIPLLSGGTALYYKGLLEGIFEAPAKDSALREELRAYAGEHGNEALHRRLQELDPVSALKYHHNDIRRVVRALEVITLTGKPVSGSRNEWSGFHDDDGAFRGELRYDFTMLLLDWPRAELYKRIEARVDLMLERGLLTEAEYVYRRREEFSRTPLQAVGYKEFFPYFSGAQSLEEAVETLKKNTRHLAKSQCTWFRKFPCERIALDTSMNKDDILELIYGRMRDR